MYTCNKCHTSFTDIAAFSFIDLSNDFKVCYECDIGVTEDASKLLTVLRTVFGTNAVHETGSRYYGNFNNHSDYDFVINLTGTEPERYNYTFLDIITNLFEYAGYRTGYSLEKYNAESPEILVLDVFRDAQHLYQIYSDFSYFNHTPATNVILTVKDMQIERPDVHLIIPKSQEMFDTWILVSNIFKRNINVFMKGDYKATFQVLVAELCEKS